MKKLFVPLYILALIASLLIIVLVSCKKESNEKQPQVFKATGDISGTMTDFRNLLGNLNTTPGVTSGRREINWDGVPDNMIGKALPNDFFNPTTSGAPVSQQRGLIYAAGVGEFRVSSTNFSDIDPASSGEFSTFSGTKAFANISANLWPIGFQVAGERTAAFSKGVGIVFSDVDLPNSTSLEFFEGEKSLGKFFVPSHTAASSFSFLGVYFPGNEHITKVQVNHDGILSDGQKDISAGGQHDLVILDDFVYAEPQKQ
ncbi:MAG TPA: hypothetical protein VFU29_19460 [Chitinophagaceae bacterium]|nr:hypothetical protein [Chitinophagaceae bacterium]